jgi:5-methylcytosine-specific restriction endonuclease McrA
MYRHIRDYLYNMEALTHKEAKQKWKQSIKDSWQNCCAYCGKPPIDDSSLTLDHVKAKCKGGEDLTDNIVPADKACNISKGSEEWKTWFRKQSFYEPWKEYRIDHWLKTGVVLEPECAKNYIIS